MRKKTLTLGKLSFRYPFVGEASYPRKHDLYFRRAWGLSGGFGTGNRRTETSTPIPIGHCRREFHTSRSSATSPSSRNHIPFTPPLSQNLPSVPTRQPPWALHTRVGLSTLPFLRPRTGKIKDSKLPFNLGGRKFPGLNRKPTGF